MDTLLSGYYKGKKDSGIFYRLFSARMLDGTKVFGIIRDYGDNVDGTPLNSVSVVCVDYGTDESYQKAYEVFMDFMH